MTKKSNWLSLLLILAMVVPLHSQQVVEVITGNIGKNKKLSKPGIYQIKGKVVGNIKINPSSGTIILEGYDENAWLQGLPWGGGTKRHVSHFSGTIGGGKQVIVRDLIIKGDGHNAMEFNGNGKKLIKNVTIINNDTTIGGKKFSHVGSINAGENSEIRDCEIHTGDDAIKITAPNSRGYGSNVYMSGNGSAIQLGWQSRCTGAKHYADDIDVYGFIGTNPNHSSPNNDLNSGRSVVGGVFQKKVSDVQITNVRIHGTKYARVIKLIANNGSLTNGTIKIDALDGIKPQYDTKGRKWYPIVLIAKGSGKINNLTIDIGGVDLTDPAVRKDLVNIVGGNNIDVTWKTHPIGNQPIKDINNLAVVAEDCDKVALSWGDVNGEDGYRVRRRIVGGTFVKLKDVPANTTSYTDNTVMEGTDYEYSVLPMLKGLAAAKSNIAGVSVPDCGGNIAPIANAGADITVEDTDNNGVESVKLDGSASDDPDGTIVSYDWTLAGSPVAAGVSPTVDLAVGKHTLTLTVTDNLGATNTDNVVVTVKEGASDVITITEVITDCNKAKKARNVIAFTVKGSGKPKISAGKLLTDGGGKYRIRDIGVKFGSTKTYKITVAGTTVSKQVTAVKSCPKSAFTTSSSFSANIYPNPSNGIINVNLSGAETASLKIMSLTGAMVYHSQLENASNTVDVSQLDKGIYIIQLQTGSITLQQKVTIL
ncbi:MAG: T9SS type A sorting domain-containing protein [Bacteroidales bacterium]|nr:T9SS type A sorting domain-containing protein [Bacteroidales bacterium]